MRLLDRALDLNPLALDLEAQTDLLILNRSAQFGFERAI